MDEIESSVKLSQMEKGSIYYSEVTDRVYMKIKDSGDTGKNGMVISNTETSNWRMIPAAHNHYVMNYDALSVKVHDMEFVLNAIKDDYREVRANNTLLTRQVDALKKELEDFKKSVVHTTETVQYSGERKFEL